MLTHITRRRFVAGAAAASAAALLPSGPLQADAARHTLTATRRTLEVNGRAASVFGLVNDTGGSGLILPPADRLSLRLDNRIGEDTIIHWHGQTPEPAQDGVTDTGYVEPVADGAMQTYDFPARSGTHWMHSHHGLQEQALLAAPLVIRSREDEAADRQEVVVFLHDFTFRSPEEVLAGIGGSEGGHGGHGMAGTQGIMGGMSGMMGGMSGMMGGMSGMMAGMDLNDVEYDAFLANDRTLADPEVIRTEAGGQVLLRIINAASSTAFWIDLGGTEGTLVAVDGNPVTPVRGDAFPLAQAQRADILVTVPAGGTVPVLAQREGDAARTGIILAAPGAQVGRISETADDTIEAVGLSLEAQLTAVHGLAPKRADRSLGIMLMGAMMPYAWSIDGRNWEDRQPLTVATGERVVIEMMNHSMMAHPMHLHGHHFQVVGINGRDFAGAMRDTVLVPPMGQVAIAFDADNPGRWLFHCHNLYHMATGMMTEVVYT